MSYSLKNIHNDFTSNPLYTRTSFAVASQSRLLATITSLFRPSTSNLPNCKCLKCFSSSTDTNNKAIDVNAPRLSVAIIGAGPSGFYAAKYLNSSVLKRIKSKSSAPFSWSGIDVDIIERLPTPYGLVRYGVAPDHPEVKNVENDFASLFCEEDVGDDSEKASDENRPSSLCYFGNVDVGKDVPLSHLQSLYHVVILAYGCQAADRRLGIPGEDTLEGVLSAREFVAWYNGHPEFGHIGHIVKRCLWPSPSWVAEDPSEGSAVSPARVVVIGQGNVALDVARVLAKGEPGLVDTDTPNSVLQVLQRGVTHVSIVGRRGHVQGAFTIKELRELTRLKKEGHDTSFIVRKEELDLGMTESSTTELKGASGRPKTRINKLLQDSAGAEDNAPDTAKQVDLRFLMNPVRMEPDDLNSDRVGSVVFERTKLEGQPFQQKSTGTDETETLPANLVLVSIGYRGMPLAGMEELQLFDNQKGVVANDHGKVSGENNLFVTGWIKRGPTGIIGTNIVDAKDTVGSVMNFIDSDDTQLLEAQTVDNSEMVKGRVGLTDYLQRHDVEAIDWRQFLKIEAAEVNRSRLRSDFQPREKILTVKEMLDVAS
eukprot:CAMPEP_0172555580 /NCGR_PEP_ID=MMETSP1067-20121228/58749_1 /TAXON_ID=265564 ORGANISM="Thalassiosira punctigera, Strain Tpunct2005C2" /NCGR_SAMPLE_ID=MMETSP1067 /ASSEMBLY_ACC=CAM_ASM_000444 /LENGTH=596 /DNA_ID=CAMNT_0013344115 /DNA_START=143 /DNA_END=1933 /DNA_ORIENTATION=+